MNVEHCSQCEVVEEGQRSLKFTSLPSWKRKVKRVLHLLLSTLLLSTPILCLLSSQHQSLTCFWKEDLILFMIDYDFLFEINQPLVETLLHLLSL